ncbi:hypothetical protein V8C86DRAFT_2440082 [Haematococcus lacustris]
MRALLWSLFLGLMVRGWLEQAVARTGARVIAGSHEHQRRFGLPLGGRPAWTERQRSWVAWSVQGKEVTWLQGVADVTSLPKFRNGVAGPKDNEAVLANRWNAFLPNFAALSPNRGQTFAQVVHTDGVAVSVLFTRPKPAEPPGELPRMGKEEGAVNPLAHLDADWLGCDPGKTNMATVAHEERYPSSAVKSVWFAGLLLMAEDVLELVPAIMAMVNGENWTRLRQSSTNAAVFEKFMIPTWYKCLKLVIKLMKPISNAIHRLEADAPYLSQV